MELLILLLAGLGVVSATVRSVITDGQGHTPGVRSTEPWKAGNLTSVPFSEARL
jgi:hypothetical protein